MATIHQITRDQTRAEHTATALRPVARWLLATDRDGRQRLTMVWRVPQVENIAAVLDSTSAY